MQVRYPSASWRPLGTQSEPAITPRILIFHTMVGSLKGTDALFRGQGYTGTESHFGVGGPWDGAALDGAVWQWQSIDPHVQPVRIAEDDAGRVVVDVHQVVHDRAGTLLADVMVQHVYTLCDGLVTHMEIRPGR